MTGTIRRIAETIEELTGLEAATLDASAPLTQLGLDSLTLTQLASRLKREFGIDIAFREFFTTTPTIAAIAERVHITAPAQPVRSAPAASIPAASAVVPPAVRTGPATVRVAPPAGEGKGIEPALPLLIAQLDVLSSQLQLVAAANGITLRALRADASEGAPVLAPVAAQVSTPAAASAGDVPVPEAVAPPAASLPPSPVRVGPVDAGALTPQQESALHRFTESWCRKTARSKAMVDAQRDVHADPRTASGFAAPWKELVYPLVVERSEGAYLWDLDGNRYIDLLNGFGPTFFGHRAPFLVQALQEQLGRGFELGPQTPLAGEAARLLCELTGLDRAAFACTGSEAVQAALRIARTYTGRTKIVTFGADYHGNFDEVLVRGLEDARGLRTVPSAPGIPQRAVDDMVVLPYGSDRALAYLREHLGDCAAVLVEPVQTRYPDTQPREFLHELRRLTREAGALLIFDEVVTGFRCHPGGAQAHFGVEADLVTYGKVLGGGMPIGVIAGRRPFIDVLDGGPWRFGDDSAPTQGVSFFAGTFVRHPLVMAAVHATLRYLRDAGPSLQRSLNARASGFVARLNALARETGAPLRIEHFASIFFVRATEPRNPLNALFWLFLRDEGVFLLEGYPSYLTLAHTDADLDAVVAAFRRAMTAMFEAGFWTREGVGATPVIGVTTEAQREVLAVARLGTEANLAYNEGTHLTFTGVVDRDRLLQVIQELHARHDALRMTFSRDNATFRVGDRALAIEHRRVPVDADGRADLRAAAHALAAEPFDVDRGPLFRAILLESATPAADRVDLVLLAHHLVCDGWSLSVLVDELLRRYRTPATELEVAPQFTAYAAREQAASDASTETFWQQEYATPLPRMGLPGRSPHGERRQYRSQRLDVPVDQAVVDGIRQLAGRQQVTLFSALLAGAAAFVAKLCGESDVVLAVPSAGQAASGMTGLVGHCVNVLPVRVTVDPLESVGDFVRRVGAKMLDVNEHQEFTIGRLLRTVAIPRVAGRLPVTPVMFNLDQGLQLDTLLAGSGTSVRASSLPRVAEYFELFLNLVQHEGQPLVIECQYDTDRFDEPLVREWLDGFVELLRDMASAPSQPTGALVPLSRETAQALETTWQGETLADAPPATVHEWIVRTAAARQEAIAVADAETTLTYAELVTEAAALARELVSMGAGPGRRVALSLTRSARLPVAMLAVMQTGAAYVPLDPEYPVERLRFMLTDSAPVLWLVDVPLPDALAMPDLPVLQLGTRSERPVTGIAPSDALEPAVAVSGDAPAYMIYTSGSTGQPKGVLVPHSAVTNFLAAMQQELSVAATDRFLALTTLSFDIAALELLLPLVIGGATCIVDRESARDPRALAKAAAAFAVTVMQATPSTWRLLLDHGWTGREGLTVLSGGEPLTTELAHRLRRVASRVFNLYGPTETTIWSTVQEITDDEPSVSIGHPIANTRIEIVDARGSRVSIGAPGELLIGGAGLAIGYHDRPALTAERFVSSPAAHGARMYRTGDLAVWSLDGTLRCLGRIDTQVKLRGHRIELGEIEAALEELPAVRESAARLWDDGQGDARLVAYVAPALGETLDRDVVLDALRTRLPSYMLPQHLVVLDALPRTPNAKLDRAALPSPVDDLASARADAADVPAAPAWCGLERVVADVWQEVLGVPVTRGDAEFFELGGHSILVARVIARLEDRLGVEVGMRRLFEHPRFEAFVEAVTPLAAANEAPAAESGRAGLAVSADGAPSDASQPAAGRWGTVLSAQQERLWYLERVEPGLTAYVLPGAFQLEGPLHLDALEGALRDFVERHDLGRVHIVTDAGQPRLAYADASHFSFRVIEAADVLADPTDARALARWIEEAGDVAMSLDEPPLIRFTLVRVQPAVHVLLLVVHHAVWDGWCFDLFLRDVGACYAARCEGRAPGLPALTTSYAAFVAQQRARLDGARGEAGLRFWSETLSGTLPDLEVMGDRPRPAQMTYQGSRVPFSLGADGLAGVRALAKAEHTTVFLTMLAVYKVLLHRTTGQEDLIVAVPVQGRGQPAFEEVVGFFVNTVVVRSQPNPRLTFREYLRDVAARFLGALEHQDTPFEWLVRRFGRRDASRTPIFQTMFTHQFTARRHEGWGDVRIRSFNRGTRSVTTDISLWVREYEERMDGGLDYRTDLFDEASAASLASAYHRLLEAVARNPDIALEDLPLLDEREIRCETRERRGLASTASGEWSALARIARHAAESPSAIATEDGDGRLTYAELESMAAHVAAGLIARGVAPGDPVVMLVPRDRRLPALLLGVLRAGAVYVPFDPTYPVERLRYMAEDSAARVALVDAETAELASIIGLQPVAADSLCDGSAAAAGAAERSIRDRSWPDASAPAYRIYTSGSTGQPKAVVVSHGALDNFLLGTQDLLVLTPSDALLAVTTVSFDISLLELLSPLVAGARVFMATADEAIDAWALRQRLQHDGITVMQATPATWRLLVDDGWSGGLRLAICGGEAFPRTLADELLARCGNVWNMYGPTETTIWSTAQAVGHGTGRVPVGRPYRNTSVYVLDSRQRPVPQGVPGEIWIGGDGVAVGYWQRDALTGERFVADPFADAPGARMYRTGDLGRWRADGTLDHLGRLDLQVKVHGYRIELGEVEAALESLPDIRQAAVDARGEDADRRLIGWVTLAEGVTDPPTSSEVRRALRDRLPAHMVPALIVTVASMPLTLNGKVDRRQLPDPMQQAAVGGAEYEPPRGEVETVIAEEWQRLLGVTRIGRHDNFFELGGHSLLSLQSVAAIERRLGRRLDPRRFFFSTLAQLAN